MPRTGAAGSYGDAGFSFLRKLHAVPVVVAAVRRHQQHQRPSATPSRAVRASAAAVLASVRGTDRSLPACLWQ